MKIAAIDIGSNAARLLINEVKINNRKPEFIKLNLLRIPLRLGMDVFTIGKIGSEREKMVIDSMKIFSDLMKIYKVDHYRACATSAMRDAANGDEIIRQVQETSGINIEIISGDEEATLIYENHVAEGLDKDFAYLYIDVGGGSTELTFYENGKMLYERSFNIGTIRLLNDLVTADNWKEMKEEIKKNIVSKKPIVAIGSGGNINKIFSMSKTKEGKPMSLSHLKKVYKEFNELSVEERMTNYSLREDRADVLVPALRIFNNVMSWSDINRIFVPKISVADGLIQNIYSQLHHKE
ncbi:MULTISPECIES: exopolyphosphatase [Chryseobacterium]|uniref:Exopolyphosphatase n=1 Tax=Chryseobacterium rhizosphaerae TaxID=395937 RepID=A0AAE4C3L5_9FLAO|nr:MULTISPECIES: exopolyphosphatase [Chryseobacterium]MBL3547433.1 exopolyphosphatase [Chryseobacterium sp. KMC2]MDC8098990.1 exopolyphosphatase [Chryseobacterium rhizosphaerae]MDR6527748.1 exopolyphosphatase/guanosine-5'-triphosphate,3'-diphosphate pyrophosphatase [Chryseobacterium rhizosphaerae]MDR6547761.1 exopolyphosphatase/guanosine-5'-triphosphate,3'-diphosphate pyrophosphatase [Chryseobacterium rhizosphaerae]REC75103.1 exopolyphosphatase [Chryseobacterium rhizosphaerae]